MQLNRSRSWLIVFAALLGAATSARGQQPETEINQVYQPFGPVDAGSLSGMQIFAPPELDPLDGFIKPATGPYFKYERLYWSIHQPSYALIGSTDPTEVGLSESTNEFTQAHFVWGNRFGIGYRQEDGYGWETSIVKSNTQFSSALELDSPTSVGFLDPQQIIPRLSQDQGLITYSSLKLLNNSRFVGIELMKTYRFEPTHNGGNWEMFVGPRFFQFHDRFDATGTTNLVTNSTPDRVPGVTDNLNQPAAGNFWDMGIDNNIVGPQIGARWSAQKEHWTLSSEFRALFGANFQTANENGDLSGGFTVTRIDDATGLVLGTVTTGTPGLAQTTFVHRANTVTFAPMGELRLDATYQLTKNASLEFGYTGLLVSGIGRASERLIYTLPAMGILNGADKQHVFMNGVNFGFNINY